MLGYRRRLRAGEKCRDAREILVQIAAARTSTQVSADPSIPARAQVSLAEPGQGLSADVTRHHGSSPPSRAGRTSPAGDRFPGAGSGTSPAAPGPGGPGGAGQGGGSPGPAAASAA